MNTRVVSGVTEVKMQCEDCPNVRWCTLFQDWKWFCKRCRTEHEEDMKIPKGAGPGFN